MFVFQTLHVLVLLLRSGHHLHPRPQPGVHHMGPVLVVRCRELVPTFDDQDAGVADVALPLVLDLEAAGEARGVTVTCREAGAENVEVLT